MERVRVINPKQGEGMSKFRGIHFGVMVLLIGVLFLLRDLGYIATKISFWTYFFLIVGAWLIIRKLLS